MNCLAGFSHSSKRFGVAESRACLQGNRESLEDSTKPEIHVFENFYVRVYTCAIPCFQRPVCMRIVGLNRKWSWLKLAMIEIDSDWGPYECSNFPASFFIVGSLPPAPNRLESGSVHTSARRLGRVAEHDAHEEKRKSPVRSAEECGMREARLKGPPAANRCR